MMRIPPDGWNESRKVCSSTENQLIRTTVCVVVVLCVEKRKKNIETKTEGEKEGLNDIDDNDPSKFLIELEIDGNFSLVQFWYVILYIINWT